MFTMPFPHYALAGNSITCIVDGFTIRATIHCDENSGPPWEEDDSHGPVSNWTKRPPGPTERVLNVDSGSYRLYDVAEATRRALADGWDGARTPEDATTAAEHDFAVLKAWCNDAWWYCGIVLSVSRADIILVDHAASLWRIECNYPDSDNSYLLDVANELLPEALDAARAKLRNLQATL
jgi:hypothetical protein